MAFRSVIATKVPMVIILGATGTGKTKLGVELAQKFGTEIISADSMQIYKGLDVVTAKASRQEQATVKHHLLDILEPHQVFTVVDFRNRALKIIDKLTEKGKIPMVVGGTNYYIESIVFNILVENEDDSDVLLWDKSRRKRECDDSHTTTVAKKVAGNAKDTEEIDNIISVSNATDEGKSIISNPEEANTDVEVCKEKLKEDVDNANRFTSEEIHAKLKSIDPVMASRLHPNNRRKVLRSIEVWLKTGRRHSEILDEQKLTEGRLRRPGATVILWLTCEQSVHDKRLNERVDGMLREGLVEELLDFHQRHNRQRLQDGKPPDYTKGIFQTLGFKEFHEYLMLPEDQKTSEEGQKLLQRSVDNMKMGTRRYARRQNKMIKGRFLDHPNREMPPIYTLDTTDVSKWEEQVKNKAIHIIESYLNEMKCEYEPITSTAKEEKKNIDGHSSNYCDICKRFILGDKEYAIHLKSNRHMKVMKKSNKLQHSEVKTNISEN